MLKTLNDTTYNQVVKDDPEDRVEVEVGDSKQVDFKPQVKIMRWDNEVNFSMRVEEKVGATVEEQDGVIKYITTDYEVHQYDKPDASEEGGFEFEWLLKVKPVSNVLEATIQTKELDFFYQPALTQKEKDEGMFRPENVEDSYAVYHKTKGGINKSDGMKYKVGKAFHIYRPKAIDSDGNEIWCGLNINTDAGILKITIPQSFLDAAVYPIKVDPTFGYTTVGASSVSAFSGDVNSIIYSLSENGDVSSISLYTVDGGETVKALIYSDNASYPDALTGGEGGTADAPAVADWITMTYGTPVSLASGSWWLSMVCATNVSLFYDSGSTNQHYRAIGTYYDAVPDPFPAGAVGGDRMVSIYATYQGPPEWYTVIS